MADTSKKKRASDFGWATGRQLGHSYPVPRCRSALESRTARVLSDLTNSSQVTRSFNLSKVFFFICGINFCIWGQLQMLHLVSCTQQLRVTALPGWCLICHSVLNNVCVFRCPSCIPVNPMQLTCPTRPHLAPHPTPPHWTAYAQADRTAPASWASAWPSMTPLRLTSPSPRPSGQPGWRMRCSLTPP